MHPPRKASGSKLRDMIAHQNAGISYGLADSVVVAAKADRLLIRTRTLTLYAPLSMRLLLALEIGHIDKTDI